VRASFIFHDALTVPDPERRRLLLGLSAASVTAGAAAALAWRRIHAPPHTPAHAVGFRDPHARFQRPLRVPSGNGLMADCQLRPGLKMVAKAADLPVFGMPASRVWHYACDTGTGLAANPLLHAVRGGMLDVVLDNHLDEDTTIHWHGLHVDEANDGSGLHPVAPGTQRRYRLHVTNRAGLYWYHAHPHARTGYQLHLGLAGLICVVDDEELALREQLALHWGVRDLPLMISDKQVDERNAIVYRDGADDWIGNRLLVNWTPEPYLDVGPCRYRFRLANVCNARMLRLAFVDGDRLLPFHLIGTDGGLLARAWRVEDLFLAPAQRADVLVDFNGLPQGARVRLRSLDYAAMENEDESGALAPDPMGDHPGAAPMGGALDVMELRINRCTQAHDPPVPEILSALPSTPDTDRWPVRALRLRMDTAGTWFINDWNFHRNGHAPMFAVKRGAREVWELRNSMTSMPHPMHVHGLQFRVVSRRISPPDLRARAVAANGLTPQDLGLTDTVVVWPGEIVRIALDFSQPFHGMQRYMLHCHNLEHEDQGMMATFAVID
jgi:blue copper oxidase